VATVEDDLKSFTQFVNQRIKNEEEMRLSELFELWMRAHSSESSYADNVAAINASIDDFRNGERGTPAGEHSRNLREQFGFDKE